MDEPAIYFCGSIRGGRDHATRYHDLIDALQTKGTVLSEHVGYDDIEKEEKQRTERDIYQRDCEWIDDADIMIAEVTTPSLGVGYELAQAQHQAMPVLCLFDTDGEHALSAMVRGCPHFTVEEYTTIEDAITTVHAFIDEQV